MYAGAGRWPLVCGSPAVGEQAMQALRQFGSPAMDALGPMPYRAMQSLIDPLWQKGIRAYFKATNLTGVDDALIERLHDLHLSAPGPQCEMHLHQMGGAVASVGEKDSAFSERSMPFVLNAVTGWQDADAGPAHADWARAVIAAASDASTGRAYVNFLGDADAARSSYGAEKYAALQELKRRYDPTNVFRLNQNVEPGEAA